MRAAMVTAAWFVLAASGVAEARAQGGVVPSRRPATDTTKAGRDSTKRDSLALVAPDSVERALMLRKGFIVTRYQGDSVKFNSDSGLLSLFGKPSIVVKEKMRAVGTTIGYNQNTQQIQVAGNPAQINDPSRPDPIIAYKPITYHMADHRGTAGKIETKASSGNIWYVKANKGGFVADSLGPPRMYGEGATLTTDGDTVPRWYFGVGQYKEVDKNYMVARPAILYIGEVPVFWIPWLYQDMRKGRRNGILTPRFGVAEIVRNSPDYRRTVDNIGYYIAPNDYTDFEIALDWRSGARPTGSDPGFLTLRGLMRYAWKDWFIDGNVGVNRQAMDDGRTSTTITWGHQQQFSKRSSLNLNFNYATSTTIARQTELNPLAVVSTIASRANYQNEFGPIRASLGATQTQYLGRTQLDRGFPSLNLASKPIAINSWLTWTPSLNVSSQQSYHLDSPSEFARHFVVGPDGKLDSVLTDRSTSTSQLAFATPIKAGNFTVNASVNLSDRLNNFPEAKLVIDPVDTSRHRTIVYKRTYLTMLDWTVGINLPQFLQGTYNMTPSVTLQNVDPGGYLVRSERTGADFVSQSKRLVYGLSTSPTYFGLFQHGFGPFAAFRHSITPTFTYSYSPAASVSDAYLAALGRTRVGYLGAIAQNRVSLSLSQVFEAKYRARDDSGSGTQPANGASAEARKIRLLSLQFSSVDYDFERARVTKRSGFATDRFHASMRSDWLPGVDVGLDYSLFDAPSISDSAHFKPYLEQVSATLNLGNGGASLGFLKKLLVFATGEAPPVKDTSTSPAAPAAQAGGGIPLSGSAVGGLLGRSSRSSIPQVQTGAGWQANLTLSMNHPRPPHGSNVVSIDPRESCEPYRIANPVQYDICLSQQSPIATDLSRTLTTSGGLAYRVPGQASVNGNLRFNLTPNWAAQWNSSYDLQHGEFASQLLALQRDIHDWQAIFSFSQASNGNFAFNFQISLKPAPDIKVPFNRTSYRAGVPGSVR